MNLPSTTSRTRIPARMTLGLACVMNLFALACGSHGPYVWARDVPTAAAAAVAIRPGDRVFVLVRGQEAASGELPVQQDGSIVHPLAGRVAVAGLAPAEAAARVTDQLRSMLVDPHVLLSIAASTPSRVSVLGEVREGGHFDTGPEDGVLAALARAGGLTEFADGDAIFVVRREPESARVRFRYDDLIAGEPSSVGFRLRNGDVVVVE